MAKNDYRYFNSVELKVVRIEIFSFSKLAVPFYWIELPSGEIKQIGGSVIGRLAEMENPLFEAKEESNFIHNIYPFLEENRSITSYDYACAAHSVVKDSGMFKGRVLVDVFKNGKNEYKYCVGASDFIYRKEGDKIALILDEVELEKWGVNNA